MNAAGFFGDGHVGAEGIIEQTAMVSPWFLLGLMGSYTLHRSFTMCLVLGAVDVWCCAPSRWSPVRHARGLDELSQV